MIQNTLQQKKPRPTKAVRFLFLLKSLFFSPIMLRILFKLRRGFSGHYYDSVINTRILVFVNYNLSIKANTLSTNQLPTYSKPTYCVLGKWTTPHFVCNCKMDIQNFLTYLSFRLTQPFCLSSTHTCIDNAVPTLLFSSLLSQYIAKPYRLKISMLRSC